MKPVLWEVDAQVDFMLPGGKLYVPGAEKIISNVNRLIEAARHGHIFLISSADAHNLDDPELREWPAHCVKGTPGAELIPEARATGHLTIPNQRGFILPRNLGAFRQIILQKNTLDVFDNPNTEPLLARLNASSPFGSDSGPDFLVFGVVTELCVRCAVEGLLRRGFRVGIIKDAIQALDEEKGNAILSELQSRGACLISTDEALRLMGVRGSTVAA